MDVFQISFYVNFNTPDSLVLEYLAKHGRVVKNAVVYEKVKEGPLAGLKNGNRKYQVDLSEGINMGSYHIIDGARVYIYYAGQKKTCGRCFETNLVCPGGGIAKLCAEKGGPKVSLEKKMVEHWRSIKFEPTNFKLEPEEQDSDPTVVEKDNFSPVAKLSHVANSAIDSFMGVLIKNLPEALPPKELRQLLTQAGLDDEHSLKIDRFGGKMTVEISSITNELAKVLIDSLNGIKVHDNKIYCRGVADLFTPEKQTVETSQQIPKIDVQESSPQSIIPGLVLEEKSKSQRKRERKKKKPTEKIETLTLKDLRAKHFIKLNKAICDTTEFEFSDVFPSETDDDLYNTCNYESDSSDSDSDQDDKQQSKKPADTGLVAETVASFEDIATSRPRSGSTKKPGSPLNVNLERRAKKLKA